MLGPKLRLRKEKEETSGNDGKEITVKKGKGGKVAVMSGQKLRLRKREEEK